MSYNGSGVYTLPGAQLANGEVVSATENNQFRNDVAAALNTAWTRDGQAPATDDIPMGNNKLTGLAAPTLAGDALSYGEDASVANLNIDGNINIETEIPFFYADFSGSGTNQRMIFKTNIENEATGLRALPNGTGRLCNMAFGSSSTELANNSYCIIGVDGIESVSNITSYKLGTGTLYPLTFSVSTGVERMRITTSGEVMIAGTTDQGAYNLQVNGTGVWGAGAYVNGSDERIKENIEELGSCLEAVKAMRPVTYQYKRSYSKDQNVQPGFIAQELQTAFAGKNFLNGVVQKGPTYLNVAYQNIIPVLTKAIQEQQEQIEQLKAEIAVIRGN